jgi:hypothetical protein
MTLSRAYSVDGACPLPQDASMAGGSGSEGRRRWLLPAIGAAVGLALGIVVSITTDIPFAPEIGLVAGAVAGWAVTRRRT